jgi:hypothetical protein
MRWQIEPMPAWPYEETKQRRNSTFGASWSSTLDLLDRELYYLDVDGPVAVRVVGSPADVRRDGMLRATARLEHPGVAVSFTSKRRGPLTFPCDTFVAGSGSLSSWQANVRAKSCRTRSACRGPAPTRMPSGSTAHGGRTRRPSTCVRST